MLFSIRPALAQSRVFDGLNQFLRELMLAALEGRAVDPNALHAGLHAAIDGNEATRELADALHGTLVGLLPAQKAALRAELVLNREPCNYLTDRALALPAIPDGVFPHLKRLSVHLYERTAKLVDVEAACGECVDDHFARFRADEDPGNGNVCCVCGTEKLAQIQAGVGDHEQWRGPYDHLLAKDKYPLFGVHPANLLPICQTCNSKAKLAKDLLYKKGLRRLSFAPWSERAQKEEVQVAIDDSELFPKVVVNFQGSTVDRQAKLDTWNDVYKIKGRVEGEFLALHAMITDDVSADSEADFMRDLARRVRSKARASRLRPFNYWQARVYHSVLHMDRAGREALRQVIQQSAPLDEDMEDIFDI